LGIKDIEKFNVALLEKRTLKLGEEDMGVWKEIV